MQSSVLALVIDFRSTAEAAALTVQVARGASHRGGVTVVHVDNANVEPVSLTEAQRAAGVRLLRLDHNGGYGAGIRGAIERLAAGGETFDFIWMLNSDLEVEPDCLSRLARVLEEHPEVAAVGPTVLHGRTERVWGARGVVSPLRGTTAMVPAEHSGPLPRWSYIPGCALLVRRTAYEAAGGLPDRYGMYYEETELCVQLQRRGWELWVEPEARAYHAVDSMARGVPARHFAFYFARNNLYFWRRNFGIPWLVQLPRTLYVVARHLVVPLRHASPPEALDRLRFIAMGLLDGIPFLRHRYTRFERRHFSLEPPAPPRESR